MVTRLPHRRGRRRALGVATALAVLCAVAPPASATATLPHLNITGEYVSGISSGAAEAVQFQVAYSAKFKGLAFFAGPAYDCAQGDSTLAVYACASSVLPEDLPQMESNADTWAAQGLIDPTSNLAGTPVYEWHGTLDTVVSAPVADTAAAFLRHYAASVDYVNGVPSGHGWITPTGPEACAASLTPYLDNCMVDAEHDFLRGWLGAVNAPNLGTPTGRLIAFDQNAYAPGGDAASVDLGSTGYEYVPSSCSAGAACRLVLALHGCAQNTASVGSAFIEGTFLNQYADTNHLAVLYPQVTSGDTANNPLGCWDWWGYLPHDANYAQKSGAQMATVMNMVAANGG